MITSLSNGVTITATYENGIKHGPTTHTYPHSQTIECYYLYNQGNKVKEISYDPAGIPIEEWIQLSPTRYSITNWYGEGSPMYVEEFVGDELLKDNTSPPLTILNPALKKALASHSTRSQRHSPFQRDLIEEAML